jgi:phage replication O-like protein O
MSNVHQLHARSPGGFTRMDNDLYGALIRADLSGRELRVALAIHRQTTGYNVASARIAASYIAEMANIHREDVSRIIGELLRQRIIYRNGGSKAPIGISPATDWQIDAKNVRKTEKKKEPQCGVSTTSLVAFPPHNKDINTNTTANAVVAAVASTDPVFESEAEQADNTAPDQPEAPKAERIPFDKIMGLYNQVCGEKLPRCLKLNDKRKGNIRKCWNLVIDGEKPFRKGEFWEGYFNDCLQDKHWLGENDRGWRAHLEFLTREENVLRVLEGV